MAQLGLVKFSTTFYKDKSASDVVQVPANSATISVYRRGATISTGTTVTTVAGGVAVSVYNAGDILLGDTVQLGTDATKQMTVEELTSITSVKLRSTIGASIPVTAGQRLVIYSRIPTIYSEASGTDDIDNPTDADSKGLVEFFIASPMFDLIASGPGLTDKLMVDNRGGSDVIFRVTDFGAKGDGSTNDAAAINATIVAAELVGGAVLFPPSPTDYISSTGGHVLKKTTSIFGYGATLKLTSATATLLAFGNGFISGGAAGGVYGLELLGNNGASDTSIGIRLGMGENDLADYVSCRDMQITKFGHGIVIADGAANQNTIDRCTIASNIFNGIRVDATFNQEPCGIINCTIINNGISQATGSGIQFGANTRVAIVFHNCKLHHNGNGTLGQIYGPSTAGVVLRMTDCDLESIDVVERSAIQLLGVGNNRVNIYLSGLIAGDEFAGVSVKPLIVVASADLYMSSCRLAKRYGSTIVPMINIGNGDTLKENAVTLRGVRFDAVGTVANAQTVGWTGTAGQYGSLDMTGSGFGGFQTATNPISYPNTLRCVHDVAGVLDGTGITGRRKLTGLNLMWDQEVSREVVFNLDHLTYASASTIYSLKIGFMNGQVGFKCPVVATGNLFGAGADHDGSVVIEDAGAGNRNLIIYAGGERFRIDGGAAF